MLFIFQMKIIILKFRIIFISTNIFEFKGICILFKIFNKSQDKLKTQPQNLFSSLLNHLILYSSHPHIPTSIIHFFIITFLYLNIEHRILNIENKFH